MKRLPVMMLFIGCMMNVFAQKSTQSFYAYYTQINSSETFEVASATGEYADIIVHLPAGKLIFWRGTSYLPQWQTAKGKWTLDELVPRKGDGSKIMPDRVNTFSHVAIIKNTADTILIHWRYLPAFSLTNYPFAHTGFGPTDFADEYFYIAANGYVRRVLNKGTKTIDEYRSAVNTQVQLVKLNVNGLLSGKLTAATVQKNNSISKVKPVAKNYVLPTIAAFDFDEAAGNNTTETVTGLSYAVLGHKALWKKGISGSALQFDGYTSAVNINSVTPVETNAITISSWIVIGAYPWNWVPIVQSGTRKGFFLGVNAYGYPGFSILLADSTCQLVSAIHLERNTWYNIAASYTAETGWMKLFINGKCTDSLYSSKYKLQYGEDGLQIGKSTAPAMPTDAVRPTRTYQSSFGFDGLIDEVQLYHQSFSNEQIKSNYKSILPINNNISKPDIQQRKFPRFKSSNTFRAYYTHLKYYEIWDNLWRFGDYPDVVVEFANNPSKFVFWRGTSYIPHMVNDKNQWFTNEFNETWNKSGGEGCMEPMSDKENYSSHARIVEQTPARVVINWRVPLMDVNKHVYANYDTLSGWGDWIDWYYYIYPDGVAVKKMRLYTHGDLNHEWQESIVLMEENQKPEEVLESTPVFTSIDTSGKETFYNWEKTPPASVNFKDALVHKTNLKSDWDVYTIQHFTGADVYNSELTPYSIFCTWNHWPTAQIASDGRNASFPDRASHSSTTHVKWPFYKTEKGNKPFAEKLLMEGLSNKTSNELYQLALSWLYPAAIENTVGITTAVYDPSQKAYQLVIDQPVFTFSLKAAEKNPVVNPAFVISNWNSEKAVEIRLGKKLLKAGTDFQQGLIYNRDGKLSLIVWVNTTAVQPIDFTFKETTSKKYFN